MAQSKMLWLRIINFESIEDATLYFDERGCLILKGYNDSGKSAVINANRVFFYNWEPRKQDGFIQDDKTYFRLVGGFDDGVIVLRDKYTNGSSMLNMYKDGKMTEENLVYTNKQGNTLLQFEGIPEVVAEYLGVASFNNMYLNARDSKDPLFLVHTSGSENYSALSYMLRTEELSLSAKLLNADKNKKQSEIGELNSKLAILKSEYNSLYGYTEQSINALKTIDNILTNCEEKEKLLSDLDKNIKEAVSLVDIPKLEELDSIRFKKINIIVENLKELEIEISPQVPTIDSKKLSLIRSIINTYDEINTISEVPTLSEIETDRVKLIAKINSEINEINKLDIELNLDVKTAKKLKEEIDNYEQELKKLGGETVVCNNCGSLVVIN